MRTIDFFVQLNETQIKTSNANNGKKKEQKQEDAYCSFTFSEFTMYSRHLRTTHVHSAEIILSTTQKMNFNIPKLICVNFAGKLHESNLMNSLFFLLKREEKNDQQEERV